MVLDAWYGTTSYGGNGYGTVYRLQPPAGFCRSGNCPWTETVLYSFQGGSDGWNPGYGDLAFDQQGNIYGTTGIGGTGCNGYCGVVFKLTRSGGSWSYSVLYSFQGGDDGENPGGEAWFWMLPGQSSTEQPSMAEEATTAWCLN